MRERDRRDEQSDRRRTLVALVALLGGGAIALAGIGPAQAVDLSFTPTDLEAVSAASPTDAWAVGFRDGGAQALILHGNGSSWAQVPNPVAGKLFGVSAPSSADAWAVGGTSRPRSHTFQTLTLRWNGAVWTRIPSPNPSPFLNELHGVSAISANDVWAVGYTVTPRRGHRSLVLHWNGARWTTMAVPGTALNAVSAISSRNAWAVGDGVLLHWNGARWSKQSVRSTMLLESVPLTNLLGVSAVSPSDVWAVGNRCARLGTCIPRTEVIHWNGARWSTVPSPVPSRYFNSLNGVSASSPRDAWAVGAYCVGRKCAPERNLTLHWDGRRWSTVPTPRATSSGALSGVADASPAKAWAVGDRSGGSGGADTLLLDWDGSSWSTP